MGDGGKTQIKCEHQLPAMMPLDVMELLSGSSRPESGVITEVGGTRAARVIILQPR